METLLPIPGVNMTRAGIGMCISTSVRLAKYSLCLEFIHFAETKNTWARDDPAIIVLITACLVGMLWMILNE